jgi:hypothetical protein
MHDNRSTTVVTSCSLGEDELNRMTTSPFCVPRSCFLLLSLSYVSNRQVKFFFSVFGVRSIRAVNKRINKEMYYLDS